MSSAVKWHYFMEHRPSESLRALCGITPLILTPSPVGDKRQMAMKTKCERKGAEDGDTCWLLKVTQKVSTP